MIFMVLYMYVQVSESLVLMYICSSVECFACCRRCFFDAENDSQRLLTNILFFLPKMTFYFLLGLPNCYLNTAVIRLYKM